MDVDDKKISACHADLIDMFHKHKLNIGEILITYGNLGYTLGASIDGHTGKGPTEEELKKAYYTNPTVGVGLMLQGIEVTGWYNQLVQLLKDKEKENDTEQS
jgi:hypothetical protein